MKLLPPSMWRDTPIPIPEPTTPHLNLPPNPRAPYFSSIWRSLVSEPLARRSTEAHEKRKDSTLTITNTETITEQLTIYHNQTVFSTLTTEIFFTRNITSFVPTTITHNTTMTTPITVSVPFTTTVSTNLPHTTTHTAPTTSHAPPTAAAANTQAPAATISEPHDALPTKWILAIVFGVLGFLVLLVAVLWGIRWFLQKYRHERVERKRLQTEANELPVMKTGDGEGEMGEMGERGGSGLFD